MITFQSEEDAASAYHIASSPRMAALAMDVAKDN